MPAVSEGRVLNFTIRARSDELCRMRDAVRTCVEASGCSETPTADIVLVIDEACQNIIRHAYKGDPNGEIPPGTPFAKLPDDWVCPICGASKEEFSPHEE